MARTASFTSSGQQVPGGGMTLAALMARQKQLADRQTSLSENSYPGAGTIAGGLGHMADMFFTGLGEAKAQQQEAEGRQALAQAISGIDLTKGTADPAQLSTIYSLDPEVGSHIMDQLAAARRAEAEYQRTRTDTLSDRSAQYQHEADVNARTVQQTKDAEARKLEQGKLTTVTGDEAKARGLDPSRTWQVDIEGKATDITPDVPVSYGPVVTGEEAKALGLDPAKSYQHNNKTGQYDQIGGAGTTVNVGGGGTELDKKMSEQEAKTYAEWIDQGVKAQGILGDMQIIDQLAQAAPQGGLPGAIAQRFPQFTTAGAAFQSVIKRLAPTMRATGSGSTSDIEYAGMLESLPQLANNPEANRLISQMFKSKAQLDIQRSNLIQQWRMGGFDPDPAKNEAAFRKAISAVNNQTIMTPELRAMLDAVAKPQGSGAPTSGTVGDVEWSIDPGGQ